MKETIDCRIIQDLLPLYVDGLTSNYSNQVVEAHLKECPECAQILKYMQEPDDIVAPQKKEVDFMRKIRNKTKVLKAFSGTVLILFLAFLLAGYLIYDRMTPRSFSKVFGVEVSEVETCKIAIRPTIGDWEDVTIEADEFMDIMEQAGFYYEGLKSNIMYGGIYWIDLFDQQGQLLTSFCVSDEEMIYTDKYYYSINKNPEILEYLSGFFREGWM